MTGARCERRRARGRASVEARMRTEARRRRSVCVGVYKMRKAYGKTVRRTPVMVEVTKRELEKSCEVFRGALRGRAAAR